MLGKQFAVQRVWDTVYGDLYAYFTIFRAEISELNWRTVYNRPSSFNLDRYVRNWLQCFRVTVPSDGFVGFRWKKLTTSHSHWRIAAFKL